MSRPDLTQMPVADLAKRLAEDREDRAGTLAELERTTTSDRRGLLDDLRRLDRDIATASRVLAERTPGAVPGLPVNWPSPSTNTPNVDEHPLEHYWSDRMTEPRPEDVERLARWLEEDIQKNSGTEFAYRAWARELLLRLSIKP